VTAESDLAIVLVLVIILEGIWLAGLTYLMWRRSFKKPKQGKKEEPPAQAT
jgi:hypothetical protein